MFLLGAHCTVLAHGGCGCIVHGWQRHGRGLLHVLQITARDTWIVYIKYMVYVNACMCNLKQPCHSTPRYKLLHQHLADKDVFKRLALLGIIHAQPLAKQLCHSSMHSDAHAKLGFSTDYSIPAFAP